MTAINLGYTMLTINSFTLKLESSVIPSFVHIILQDKLSLCVISVLEVKCYGHGKVKSYMVDISLCQVVSLYQPLY